jgi:hypothetical protein
MEEGRIIKFPELKIVNDDFEVELGVVVSRNNIEYIDLREQDITDELNEINETLSYNNKRIDELN